MCANPSAMSCQIVAKPDVFYSKESCVNETKQIAANMMQQGVYAMPQCHQISKSV
jgi:hypothetical protein